MNTAHNILTEIYLSKELAATIAKVRPTSWQEDIKQHVFTELFAKPDADILDLHKRGKLKSYVARMIWNVSQMNKHNEFARKTGLNEMSVGLCHQSTFEVVRIDESQKQQLEAEQSVNCVMEKMHWYKANIMKLYAELGTYKAVTQDTGIPTASIFRTVREAKKEIKSKI